MNRSRLDSFKSNPAVKRTLNLLSIVWNVFDIGRDSEPEEYRGKSPLAYYDHENTLETAVAHTWAFLVESPARSEKLAHVVQATRQKKNWLLDLSREPAISDPVTIRN